MLCHRAVEWCNKNQPDKSDLFMEKMFSAYFEMALDVSKLDNLLICASDAGLDTEILKKVLLDGITDSKIKTISNISFISFI